MTTADRIAPLVAEAAETATVPLARATTLPPAAYTDAAVFDAEVDTLFSRQWLCAARVDQLPNPGDYAAIDLIGRKLILCRDSKGDVHALSRVCLHRNAELVRDSGRAKMLVCPYHSWTYHLDGRLAAAPLMDGAEGFERNACRLPRFRCETWRGWIFVNFDDNAAPLASSLTSLDRHLAGYDIENMIATEPIEFDSSFNWKVLVDNFMEAYHHIAIHRETFEPLFPAKRSYTVDNDDGPYSLLIMPADPEAPALDTGLPTVGNLDEAQHRRLLAGVVYPCHLFAPGGEFLTWYQVLPESHDRFTLRIHLCFPATTLADERHAEAVTQVRDLVRHIHHEDIVACEATWAGLQSPAARRGRLSPLEKPIWQFNRWWVDRMKGL